MTKNADLCLATTYFACLKIRAVIFGLASRRPSVTWFVGSELKIRFTLILKRSVWAINPNKDQLSDLVQRMRRFASDLFTARQIEFTFAAPSEQRTLKIGADLRRQVFLIFKEAVNNIARHSACTEAAIEMRIENRWLMMKVVDDGPGFDATHISEGLGLASMRARAQSLGGELQIISNDGNGTRVLLKVPLTGKASLRGDRVR